MSWSSCAASVGEATASVRMRTPLAALASSSQLAEAPPQLLLGVVLDRTVRSVGRGCIGVCERSGSYSPSTDACAKTSVAPRLAGWSGLPSTLVGRPSWLSTSRPTAVPARVIAVA